MNNKPVFIYLKGVPGTGKITVARILKRKLGYRLFWFHDLKNAIFRIVKEHRLRALMNEVTGPIVKYLVNKSENVIYIRPSADPETVKAVGAIVKATGHKFVVINLTANYKELVKRVSGRREKYRISNKKDLDAYLATLPGNSRVPGEHNLDTSRLTPEQVADKIIKKFKLT